MKPSGSYQKNPLSNAPRSATEPDRTEETLRFQKALLEAQSEASIDGILVVSTEGKMISFNRRFIEMWGIPDDVIQSRSDEAALQWALDKLVDPQEFLARVAYLYEHPGEESRDEIVLKDGRTFDRYSAPVRDKDGTHYGRVWYFRDVTEHKRADEALRHSEERFRSLVQYASDIITVLGADGTVRYESPSMERIMGYDPQELVGTNAFDRIHPEDVEQVWDAFTEALQNQGVSPPVEFRLRHADGSWRYLEAIGYNRLDDPSVRGMVVNSRDITERKQAERE
ncbi:MAG TPA: PAS domain S-box protein, partial [Rubrobacteraceae bacterium]|nr:PAS domain S-box protein [Rubrobacteraceae bacterium]